MAKRTRDYRAEYAKAKAKAQSSGFRSDYARKKSRQSKDYEAAGFASFSDYEETRRRAAAWSANKSVQQNSAFNPAFSAQQTRDYSRAFLGRSKSHTEFIEHLAAYLHGLDPEAYPSESDTEFWANY